jgi:hypothetical protein
MMIRPAYLAIALASAMSVATFGAANAQASNPQDQSQARYDQNMSDYQAQQREHADADAAYRDREAQYQHEKGAYDAAHARYERNRMRYDRQWGAGAYERRYGAYHDDGYYTDAYYDDFYGPYNDGYWAADGVFYFRMGADQPYRRDDAGHFRRDSAGSGFHHVQAHRKVDDGDRARGEPDPRP